MMPVSEKLALCVGCHQDFYNGKNDLGVKVCWSLESAEPVKKKFIHLDSPPPWKDQEVEDTLSCHRRPRHIKVDPEVTC